LKPNALCRDPNSFLHHLSGSRHESRQSGAIWSLPRRRLVIATRFTTILPEDGRNREGGMPWSAWWETVQSGSVVPLAATVFAQAVYYLWGVHRMTTGRPPWGCGPPDWD
jgi:hypothetical protein